MQEIWTTFMAYVPQIVGAVVILVVGWILALLISRGIAAALRKSKVGESVKGWFADSEDKAPDVPRIVGLLVFWILVVLVVAAAFQVLKVPAVTDPLLNFVDRVFAYLPRLVGPVILLLVAVIVAALLRLLVRRGSKSVGLDQRFAEETGDESQERVSLSDTLAEAAYWLTLLLFLPAILGALNLQGLLQPVQNMTDRVLSFLPNLFAAAIIFVVGWFVAKVFARLITNLLKSIGTDRVPERVGLTDAFGSRSLSEVTGLLLYILILVPVIIAGLNALNLEAVTAPASLMLTRILEALPAIATSLLVLAIAYIVGRIVSGLVTSLLSKAGFDGLIERVGLANAAADARRTPSEVAGWLVLVAIMFFAFIEAFGLVGFENVADLASQLLVFLTDVLLGIVVFGVGLLIANLAVDAIQNSKAKQKAFLATAARVAVLILAGAMALRAMGFAEDIVNLAFGLMLGAVAVAVAIAFGVGGRDTAAKVVDDWYKRFQGTGSRSSQSSSRSTSKKS